MTYTPYRHLTTFARLTSGMSDADTRSFYEFVTECGYRWDSPVLPTVAEWRASL